MFDYQNNRHGSAQWAGLHHLNSAGLIGKAVGDASGMYHGEFHGRSIHVSGSSPALLIGGSGTGKLASLLGYTALVCPQSRRVYVDPKGEICSIALDNLVRWGKGGYVINPLGMHGLPQHTIDPFSMVDSASISMTGDAKLLAADLVAVGASDNPFFEKRAQAWAEAFIKYDAITHGRAALRRVYNSLNVMMQRDSNAWVQLAQQMDACTPEIATVINEIVGMQGDDGRAYGIITAELNSAFSFMTDPAIRAALSESPDLDLHDFCTSERDNDIYFIVPAELMGVWAPFIRLVISALMIIKRRVPHAPQIDFIVDEAGQLQKTEFLPQAMTFGRGAGIKTYAVFQDIGQIEKYYGRQGLTTFIGSAETRQLIGTRDPMTARIISEMLGNTTLSYIDETQRERAEMNAKKAIMSGILGGQGFMQSVIDARAMKAEAQIEQRMARPLASIDEILNQPNGAQILFVSGRDCPPIAGQLVPYWERRELAGYFFENPYHPPHGQVRVKTQFGYTVKSIIEEVPPSSVAHLPQYAQGRPFRYVEGFRHAW